MDKHAHSGTNPNCCELCNLPDLHPNHILQAGAHKILPDHIRSICTIHGLDPLKCPICVPFKLREQAGTIEYLKGMVAELEDKLGICEDI